MVDFQPCFITRWYPIVVQIQKKQLYPIFAPVEWISFLLVAHLMRCFIFRAPGRKSPQWQTSHSVHAPSCHGKRNRWRVNYSKRGVLPANMSDLEKLIFVRIDKSSTTSRSWPDLIFLCIKGCQEWFLPRSNSLFKSRLLHPRNKLPQIPRRHAEHL